MNERPPQPPEGKLIADAATACGLSIREAAKRAGISYGRWRQVTSGVQNVSPGSYAAVRAPAATLAKMARVVGLTPERLETEGQRPDAAEILREMQRPDLRPVPAPDPPPPADPDFPDDEDDDDILARIKGDVALEAIWQLRDADGRRYPREERIRLMRAHLEGMRRRARRAERDTGT